MLERIRAALLLALCGCAIAYVPSAVKALQAPAAATLGPPSWVPDTAPVAWPAAVPPKEPEHKGPSEYELNRGHVIDTLRRDYPYLLTRVPDFAIFNEDIELHDPSGKRLSGLRQYKKVFDMLRFLRRTTMQVKT